eukprot:GHVP01043695.1.p1 GENE.GHVP01043695.1~~GHVP01043695.1.p1  ORF type:complete len:753 (-),score=121.02 GHVP01043695.1:1864-4122(-)
MSYEELIQDILYSKYTELRKKFDKGKYDLKTGEGLILNMVYKLDSYLESKGILKEQKEELSQIGSIADSIKSYSSPELLSIKNELHKTKEAMMNKKDTYFNSINFLIASVDFLTNNTDKIEDYLTNKNKEKKSTGAIGFLFSVQADLMNGVFLERKRETNDAVYIYNNLIMILGKMEESYQRGSKLYWCLYIALCRLSWLYIYENRKGLLKNLIIFHKSIRREDIPKDITLLYLDLLKDDFDYNNILREMNTSVSSNKRVSIFGGTRTPELGSYKPESMIEEIGVCFSYLICDQKSLEDLVIVQKCIDFYLGIGANESFLDLLEKLANYQEFIKGHERLFLGLYGSGKIPEAYIVGKKCFRYGPTDPFTCLCFGKLLLVNFEEADLAEIVLTHGQELLGKGNPSKYNILQKKFVHLKSIVDYILEKKDPLKPLFDFYMNKEIPDDVLYTISVFYTRKGNFKKAIETARIGVSKNPSNFYLWEVLVLCLLSIEEYTEALMILDRLTDRVSMSNMRLSFIKTEILIELNLKEHANKEIKKILVLFADVFTDEEKRIKEIGDIEDAQINSLFSEPRIPKESVCYQRLIESLSRTAKPFPEYMIGEKKIFYSRALYNLVLSDPNITEEEHKDIMETIYEVYPYSSYSFLIRYMYLKRKSELVKARETLEEALVYNSRDDDIATELAEICLNSNLPVDLIKAQLYIGQLNIFTTRRISLKIRLLERLGDKKELEDYLRKSIDEDKQLIQILHLPYIV